MDCYFPVLTEQGNALDTDSNSEFLEGARFVITDTGEKISEEEYIKNTYGFVESNMRRRSNVVEVTISRANMYDFF